MTTSAMRVLEIGHDYVLGVSTDDFGVQFLGVYLLTKEATSGGVSHD